jgi:hypothetical protein
MQPKSTTTKSAPAKSASSKSKSTGYLYLVYGGCMKLGWSRLDFLAEGDIEEHLEEFKEHYSSTVKGRYVKSQTPEQHYDEMCESLKDFHASGHLYEINVTQAVAALKEATGSEQAKTWNVNDTKIDGADDEKQTVSKSQSTKETSESKAKTQPAKQVKKATKVEVEEEEEEEEEVEEEAEEEAEEEEEEVEEEVKQKGKSSASKKEPVKEQTKKVVKSEPVKTTTAAKKPAGKGK